MRCHFERRPGGGLVDKIANFFAPPKTAPRSLYPKIDLVVCFICEGRGYVPSVRYGKPCRERCVQCSGNGSIVSDGGVAA